jgi:hypothetical protein
MPVPDIPEREDKRDQNEAHRGEHNPYYYADRLAYEIWQLVKTEPAVFVSIIQAVVAIGLLSVTVGQLVVSCSSTKQTNQLITAATKIQGSADQFSQSAAGINQHISDAVGKLQIQADASQHAVAAAKQQIEDFESVQSAHLSIEQVKLEGKEGDGEVSFMLMNEGNSAAIDIGIGSVSEGGSSIRSADILEALKADVTPDSHGFTLGQGKGLKFTQRVTGNWVWVVHFAYLDIFGHTHPPVSGCFISHHGTVFQCNGAPAPK